MSEDRPLTAFSTGGSAEESESASAETAAGSADEPGASTATLTSRFLPEGAACERCGTETTRQWVDDARFVCPACKRWTVDTD